MLLFQGARGVRSGAARLLAQYGPEGAAFDFRDLSVSVRDTTTPANNFSGNVNSWLTYTSPSTKWIRNAVGVYASGATLRTEYDASGTALGVRVEPAATNYALQSRTFSSASWTKTRSSISGSTTAIDGGSAVALIEDTSTNTHFMTQSGIAIASVAQTISIFSKPAGRTQFRFNISDNATGNVSSLMDLSAVTAAAPTVGGSWSAASASIESVGGGWYRCSITATRGAGTVTDYNVELTSGGSVSYTGDGVSGVYFDQAQVETGAWASSPIVTTTATVTRAADSITKLITAMPFSATAGTLFAEFSTASPDLLSGSTFSVTFNDATSSEYISLYRYQANVGALVRDGGVTQADRSRTVVTGAFEMHRAALTYALNDVIASVDGVLTTSDTSATLPTVTRIELGLVGANQTGGHMMRGLYVPRRVSNGDLPTFGGTS